jgi:hypothetical protein
MINTWSQSFIQPLRKANPPVIRPDALEDFIEEVFGNILDLRECNRRLLEVMYVRQREQAPVIQRIGDVFLDAATEFRLAYPIYVGHLPLAEKRMKEEIETNPEFRLFLEVRCRFFFTLLDLMSLHPAMFEEICKASRFHPTRPQAFPESTFRTFTEIPCSSRSHIPRDRRWQSGR